MSDNAGKDLWIQRVLGVTIDDADDLEEEAADPAEALRRAVQGLSDGYDLVSAQIAGLQAELGKSDDPDMRRIAEYGLNALSGGLRVKLQAAVMPLLSGGRGDPENIRKLAGQFMKLLTVDAKVRAFDRNPFGVKVSIAATLKPRLLALAEAAAAAGR